MENNDGVNKSYDPRSVTYKFGDIEFSGFTEEEKLLKVVRYNTSDDAEFGDSLEEEKYLAVDTRHDVTLQVKGVYIQLTIDNDNLKKLKQAIGV